MNALNITEFSKRLYLYSLFYLAIALPFQSYIYPLVGFFALCLAWLFLGDWKKRFQFMLRSQAVWWYSFLYLLIFVGLGRTENWPGAWEEIGSFVPLLILPLLIGSGVELNSKQRDKVFWFFIYSLIISCVLSVAIGIINYSQAKDLGNMIPPLYYLFYSKLSFFVAEQPSYLALYLAMAFFIVGHFLWRDWYGLPIKKKRWYISIMLLFFVMIFLLAVRAQIIAFIITLLGSTFILQRQKGGLRKALMLSSLLIVIFTILILIPRRTRERLNEFRSDILTLSTEQKEEYVNTRVYIWRKGYEIFRENLWWGVGTANGLNELVTRADEELKVAATQYSVRDICNSDLLLGYRFINRYKTVQTVGDSVTLSTPDFWNVQFVPNGAQLIPSEDGMSFSNASSSGSIVLGSTKLEPGKLYSFHIHAHDRNFGGLIFKNGERKLLQVRERASGNGYRFTGYFEAISDSFIIATAEFLPTDIHLGEFYLTEITEPNAPVSIGPVPRSLDNSLEVAVHRLRYHSQFVEIMVAHGLIGLFVFFMLFYRTFVYAYQRKNHLYSIFLLLILISFATEHMLYRHAGLMFFAFMGPMLLLYGHPIRGSKRDEPAAK
jgi:O-antigen ligase